MLLPAVWEMYTSEHLFDEHISIGQVFYMIAYGGWRPAIPEGCPIGYAELMTACWAHNPEQRPTAGEVLGQLNKLYAAEKQRYQQEKSAEQQRAAAAAAAVAAAAEAWGGPALVQQQQGERAGGKGMLDEITALDAGQAGQQRSGDEGYHRDTDPQQHQQQQGWQPPQLRPSPFDQPATTMPTQSITPFGGGVMAGSMFSGVTAGGVAGIALEGRTSLDGRYWDNVTQDSCVVSTCCADTLGSPSPGVNELDMVEDWGSATKSSRESCDKTAAIGGMPPQQGSRGTPLGSAGEGGVPVHLEPYREGSRGTPDSSTGVGAVPVHLEPDSKAVAAEMPSAESAGVWDGQLLRKQQNRSGESFLGATESVDTGTLPPTMASLASMQITSDDVRSMRLLASEIATDSISTGPLPRTMASLGGSSWSAAAAVSGGGWGWSTGGRSADGAAVGGRLSSSSSSAFHDGGGQVGGGWTGGVGIGGRDGDGMQSVWGGGVVRTVVEEGETSEGYALRVVGEKEIPEGYGAAANAVHNLNLPVAAP